MQHSPVSSIPQDAHVVVTHRELGERAAHSNPDAQLVLITNFLAAPEYDLLVEELKSDKELRVKGSDNTPFCIMLCIMSSCQGRKMYEFMV